MNKSSEGKNALLGMEDDARTERREEGREGRRAQGSRMH